MNKRFSTLMAAALVAGGLSANAQAADIVKENYYHLQTQDLGATASKAPFNLTLTANYLGKADSVIIVKSTDAAATTDSALWKASFTQDLVTGEYVWEFKNKAVPTAQFSFAVGSDMKGAAGDVINGADASAFGLNKKSSLSGSLKFKWQAPSAAVGTAAVPSSYVPAKDSVMFLAANAADNTTETKLALIQVMKKGAEAMQVGANSVANPVISLVAVAPVKRMLTAKELNNKLAKDAGFQLFFYNNNKLTAENNALANVRFEAVGTTDDAIDVQLKAKLVAPKKDKAGVDRYSYAYLDTISYSAKNNLPDDGSRMTFRVDTLPREVSGAALAEVLTEAAYTFNFIVDPALDKDSVAVFLKASYDPSTAGTASRTYKDKAATANNLFPLQIDALGGTSNDKLILSTGAELEVLPVTSATAKPIVSTRIAFTNGEPITMALKKDKVYSVKSLSEEGKYMVGTLMGTEAYSTKVFEHLPSTQFVFDGSQLLNREYADLATSTLFPVDEDKNLYTNLTDTFEIEAMDVDIKNATIGYSNITLDSLSNYAFTFDYVSGVLDGRSITMKKDSTMAALMEDGMVFKLEQVADLAPVDGSADNGEVAQLKSKAYRILSKDKKLMVYGNLGGTSKFFITNVNSAKAEAARDAEEDQFILKETEHAGEYILMDPDKIVKCYVNSTDEALGYGGLTLANNAFAINVEKAPEYVLDAAKKHFEIEGSRGDKLAADAKGFAMLRKAGDLKAEYTKDDFKLWIDSANTTDKAAPSYFILSGAKAEKDSPALEGNFLRVMADSVDVEGYKAANGAIRLAFVPAKRIATSDSLIVNYMNEKLTAKDSVGFKGKNVADNKIGQFQFKIQYTDVDGQYLVSFLDNATKKYLAVYNDVLCVAGTDSKEAQLLKLNASDAPVGNESIDAATIKVVAGEGNVTVYGAAGKKVVVSDVLGRTTTVVATSDSQTVAVAAGVAIIAVEGEAAVKAVVK